MYRAILILSLVTALCVAANPTYFDKRDSPESIHHEPEDYCKKARGTPGPHGCACPDGKIVDPFRQYCVDASGENPLCEDPAWYLCDARNNPFLNRFREMEVQLEQLRDKAERTASVQAILVKALGPKRRALTSERPYYECWELSGDGHTACVRARNAALLPLIDGEGRSAFAIAAFEDARTDLLAYLASRIRQSSALGLSAKAVKILREMRHRLYRANYRLDCPSDKRESDIAVNAYAVSHATEPEHPEVQAGGGDVYLCAAVLSVNSTPEYFAYVVRHELAHLLDPGSFADSPEHPFHRELQALSRPDTASAEKSDLNCLEKNAETYAHIDPPFAQACRERLALLRKNPDLCLSDSLYHDGAPLCRQSQLREAFADWLAFESYAKSHPFSPAQPTKGDLGLDRIPELSRLDQLAVQFCAGNNNLTYAGVEDAPNYDTHPRDIDRANGILFVNPPIRRALGCVGKEAPELSDLNAPLDRNYRQYCGTALYSGGRG